MCKFSFIHRFLPHTYFSKVIKMKSISRPSFHTLKVFKEGSTDTVISKDNLN